MIFIATKSEFKNYLKLQRGRFDEIYGVRENFIGKINKKIIKFPLFIHSYTTKNGTEVILNHVIFDRETAECLLAGKINHYL